MRGAVAAAVELSVRRCRRARPWTGTLSLAEVSVSGGRFKVRHRGRARARAAKVRLRMSVGSTRPWRPTAPSAAPSSSAAAAAPGRGRVVCTLPKLSWTASLTTPADRGDVDDGDDGSVEDDDGSFDDEDEEPDSDESEDYWEDVDGDW